MPTIPLSAHSPSTSPPSLTLILYIPSDSCVPTAEILTQLSEPFVTILSNLGNLFPEMVSNAVVQIIQSPDHSNILEIPAGMILQ